MRVRKTDQDASGWHYADTHEAGVYLVRQVNRKPPKQMAFAVNLDPAESDPSTVTPADLQARFGKRPLLFCDNPDALAVTIERLREGTSLWEWFLAAVLVFLVLEVFLANRGAVEFLANQTEARPARRRRRRASPYLKAPRLPMPFAAFWKVSSKMRQYQVCGNDGCRPRGCRYHFLVRFESIEPGRHSGIG